MSELIALPVVLVAGTVYLAGLTTVKLAGAIARLTTRAGRTLVDAIMSDEKTDDPIPKEADLRAIPTRLQDLATVQQVWPELGLQSTLYPGGVLTLADGQQIPLAATALDHRGGFLFGLEARPEGLRAIVASSGGDAALHALAQRYTFQRAVDSLSAEGYAVVEKDRPLPTGAQQTLMRRRSASEGVQEVLLTYLPALQGEDQLTIRSRGTLPNGQEHCPDLDPLLQALHATGTEGLRLAPTASARQVEMRQQTRAQAQRQASERRR